MQSDQINAGRFKCPRCGASYRWRPEWAGQSVKCKCTQVMICPKDDPAIGEHVPTLAYRTPEKSTDGTSSAFPNKVVDLWMPVWLIAASTGIEVIAAMISARNMPGMSGRALASVGMQMIVGTAMMLGGILLAARFREIKLGPFGSAVLKLAAISVAPNAAMTLLGPIFGVLPIIGAIAKWGFGFTLYFTLLGALFDLDQNDTWYCVMVIFLVNVVFALAIMWGPLGFLR